MPTWPDLRRSGHGLVGDRGLSTAIGASAREDRAALRELVTAPLGLPAGLRIMWLGVSGYRLTYQGVSLFIDPYVSRVPLRTCCSAGPRRRMRRRRIDSCRRDCEVAGVLVGHTQLRSCRRCSPPSLAGTAQRRTARLAAHLMAPARARDLAVEVVAHEPYELGPFVVRFVPSRHSKLLFGRKVPFERRAEVRAPARPRSRGIRCGQVWGIRIDVAGTSLYHQGSADVSKPS